ncbi:MAG: sigma-70 family RNA polymerase sigma factor [Candidatus Daviesbacteria bacterium]|nr:sigma-70 family RNA polymerase sigma factor [Candidatus Daviesbacteria bacterium]
MINSPHFSPKKLARRHQNFASAYKNLALPLMKFLVSRMGGNQKGVEEVFSQTIVAAWRGWHTFERRSSYFTWICRIGLNKIADYYREEINHRSTFVVPTLESWANIQDDSLLPDEKLALEELKTAVKNCLDILPEDKRRLLYLRYWRGLSLKEIAAEYCLSERSVEGKLYRARADFKKIYSLKNQPFQTI